jgi:hypothetical protein
MMSSKDLKEDGLGMFGSTVQIRLEGLRKDTRNFKEDIHQLG